MAQTRASIAQAVNWTSRAVGRESWNPVYRALSADADAAPATVAPGEDGLAVIAHQLTARALLTVAVTAGERTSHVRIAVDAEGGTVERGDTDAISTWEGLDPSAAPAAIAELLSAHGITAHGPRLAVGSDAPGLRLNEHQAREAQAALARGLAPAAAFASIGDLDDRLRDALTAAGPRASLSLTLHDPSRAVSEAPVTWSRLWTLGELGMYRVDQPEAAELTVHPVEPGDVLGTALPLIEEGLRFAAACRLAEGAR